jgi:hypothetical protein
MKFHCARIHSRLLVFEVSTFETGIGGGRSTTWTKPRNRQKKVDNSEAIDEAFDKIKGSY